MRKPGGVDTGWQLHCWAGVTISCGPSSCCSLEANRGMLAVRNMRSCQQTKSNIRSDLHSGIWRRVPVSQWYSLMAKAKTAEAPVCGSAADNSRVMCVLFVLLKPIQSARYPYSSHKDTQDFSHCHTQLWETSTIVLNLLATQWPPPTLLNCLLSWLPRHRLYFSSEPLGHDFCSFLLDPPFLDDFYWLVCCLAPTWWSHAASCHKIWPVEAFQISSELHVSWESPLRVASHVHMP